MTSAPRRFLHRTTSRNYTHPTEPRYSGGELPASPPGNAFKLVTFNVKFAKHLGRAVTLLTRAPVARKDFGCAILSRFPIEDDRKIMLPHLARFRRIQRAAVAATIRIGAHAIRVYNVHLATMVDNGPRQRREQLAAVLEDADRFSHVVLSGDFNSDRVPEVALERGYTWPTRNLGPTNAIWAMDHILLKGLTLAGPTAYGAVRDSVGASDHKPVWARIHLGADVDRTV